MIVLDITKYFGETTGGIRTYLLQKARYVAERGDLRQVVVVPDQEESFTREGATSWYRLRSPRIPTEREYRLLLGRNRIRRIVAAERPNLIEVGSPFLVPWLARSAARGWDVPLVWFYHTNFPHIMAPPIPGIVPLRQWSGTWAWRYARVVGRMARATLVASESVALELERQRVPNVRRVTLGVNLEQFHPRRRAEAGATRARHCLPDGPLLLYAGRIAREKGLEVVLRGWNGVERDAEATLALVGQGPLRERLVAATADRRVVWLPHLADREELADLLAAADLFLAPGPAETFGLAALEAMASGTPVLAVDCGPVAERVTASGAGGVYAPGRADDFAQAALGLLTGDLGSLSRAARAYAERHHSWRAAFDRIFAVYDEVLRG